MSASAFAQQLLDGQFVVFFPWNHWIGGGALRMLPAPDTVLLDLRAGADAGFVDCAGAQPSPLRMSSRLNKAS